MLQGPSPYQHYSDELLLQQMAEGHGEALTALYRRYWQSLYAAAYNILKDKAACEDILQDIFCQLWEKRQSIAITQTLSAYLHAATRYRVYKHIKQGNITTEMLDNLVQKLQETGNPENDYARKELLNQVNAIVSHLPERCRLIYQLSRQEQLSHKEIAERLQISTKTVEAQLTIALRKIKLSVGGLSSVITLFLYNK